MIVAVAQGEALRERVVAHLQDTPWDTTVAGVESVGEVERILSGTAAPTVVIVGASIGIDGAGDLAQSAKALRHAPAVMLVAEPTTELLRTAMRSGIRDVLPPDFGRDDLIRAFEDAGVSTTGPALADGLTVSVFSTKGGVGTSVLAANLAIRLASRTGQATTLLDLDLASADQAILHGQSPRWTIQDIADGAVGLDPESLDQVLLSVDGTHARLLPGPLDPALAETISSGQLAGIIAAARSQAPLAVLDTASSFDDRTLAALDASDVVVVATSLDVAALRSLTVSLQTLKRLGIEEARTVIALVRADSKAGLLVADIERAIDRKIDVGVPSTRHVPRSVNEGVPLAISSPKSSVVQAIDEIVDLVLAHAPEDVRTADSAGGDNAHGGLFRWSRGSREDASTSREGSASAPQQPEPPASSEGGSRSAASMEEGDDVAAGGSGGAAGGDDDDQTVSLPPDIPRLDDIRKQADEPQVRRIRRAPARQQISTRRAADLMDLSEQTAAPTEEAVEGALSSMPPPVLQPEDDEEPRRRRRR